MIKKKVYSNRTINRTIFYEGDLSLLQEDCVGVAGSRQIDDRSAAWLRNRLLKIKTPIISGLAIGTDTIAHETAIENGVPTIAVLPCGIWNIAPRENKSLARRIVKEGGLLVSSYPARVGASREKYIARNKDIAILSKYLIVPQFESRSGTRYTVDFAKERGKPIVVRNWGYSGNVEIIQDSSYKTIS